MEESGNQTAAQGSGSGGMGALRPPSVRVAMGFGAMGGVPSVAEAALAAAEAASPAAGHRPTLLQAKEDNPNAGVYKKVRMSPNPKALPGKGENHRLITIISPFSQMEAIIERMQDENTGVPVKTVKSLMAKIPSVFTGKPLWFHATVPGLFPNLL